MFAVGREHAYYHYYYQNRPAAESRLVEHRQLGGSFQAI